jgi:hypothetical protein
MVLSPNMVSSEGEDRGCDKFELIRGRERLGA